MINNYGLIPTMKVALTQSPIPNVEPQHLIQGYFTVQSEKIYSGIQIAKKFVDF
jgi:hypothetical protein